MKVAVWAMIPADAQKALAEHDAALRAAHNADLIAASLDFDEERADFKAEIIGLRESYRKLEAENAELRRQLESRGNEAT